VTGAGLTRTRVLRYRPPFAWQPLIAFLAARAIPGVEAVDGGVYRRVIDWEGEAGHLEARHRPERHAVELRARLPDARAWPHVVARAVRLFDLDSDPGVIAEHFRGDLLMASRVRRVPGLRVPGAWDGFELGVRAILGQQVTVKGASTLAGRLVVLCGRPIDPHGPGLTHVFPRPSDVAGADLSALGIPTRRRESLQAFAGALARDEISLLQPDADVALRALPGLGDWTVQYILMRAGGDPDAFPASDLWLRRASGTGSVSELLERAEAWRPWRAYAAMYLWQGGDA
jgi:AraC family transcriptional regulator of adaptative response / DNA-3-methyladenine glycosylase II